ncbi:MAG: lactate utilization protein [Desulforhopalus sp.]|nr:lactate utilization protein [Desulforhopalus sp.]
MANTTVIQGESDLLCARFTDKAKAVSATVHAIKSFDEAVAYAVNLCGTQGACRIAISGCEEQLSPPADALCHLKHEKIVVAPGLDPEHSALLQAACAEGGFAYLQSGMRAHLSGVDIGFTVADLGIAETGTLVINCPGEDLRLATMICEYHVCVVRRSAIVVDAFAAEQQMLKQMRKTPNYMAFITGASRTADIERVLALGVHGPLELHILLLED